MVDERLTFSNGAEYSFKSLADRNSTAVGIWVREGARNEPSEFKGIAHYLEHLLFKGSQKYSYRKIKEEIEGRGGQLNGFTSQEATCYYARVLNRNVDKTLDILLDMVMNPLLKKSDIDRERQVIHEEINMYNDMPSAKVMSILDLMLWPKDPLGIDVIGTQDSVDRIDAMALSEFRDQFYHPENIVVTVCGSDSKNIKNIIEEKVHSKSKKISSDVSKRKFIKVPKGRLIQKEIKPFNQTHMALGFAGVDYFSKDRFTLELIHTILGANMSARLFESLREKHGLAYDISTSTRKYKNTGAFMVHCGLDGANTLLAFKLVIKELDKIKAKTVSKRELKRAQDYIVGNLLMNFESSLSNMLYIGESIVARNKVFGFDYIEKNIMAVTPEDILRVAAKIFDYNYMKIALVTNNKDDSLESKLMACIK